MRSYVCLSGMSNFQADFPTHRPNAARNFEMAGGDPFLAGVTAAETILGIQGQGVSACAKHYIVSPLFFDILPSRTQF